MSCICEKKEDEREPLGYEPVERSAIVAAARSAIGTRFLHQGRSLNTGVDCVGLCIYVIQACSIRTIYDIESYKRTPSASTLREYLDKNLAEIPLGEALPGDIILMRLGGAKPRHVGIIVSDSTDRAKGIEPSMVHALSTPSVKRVIEQPLSKYSAWFTAAFKVPGAI